MAELDDKVIVTKDKITDIADTIRETGGTSARMTLDEMPDNIRAIGEGGGNVDAPLFVCIYPNTVTCNLTFAKIEEIYAGTGDTKASMPQLIYKHSSGDDNGFRSVYGEVEQYDEDTFIFTFNMGFARGIGKTQWQDRIIEIQFERGDSLSKIADYTLEYQKPVVAGDGIELENIGTGINRKTQISVADALMIIGESSGSVASFDDGGANMPMKSCLVEIDSTDGVSECNIANISDADKVKYFKGLLNGTYAFVDMGTLTWGTSGATYLATSGIDSAIITTADIGQGFICSHYPPSTNWSLPDDKTMAIWTTQVRVKDTDYATSEAFKTAMNGVYLIYELATPTTPTITISEFNTLLTAFGLDGWIYNIDFVDGSTPLTVHDGEFDVVTGVLTVNDTTPPTTYQLTPTEIKTLLGINNIFADTGDVLNAEYTRDATIIINELLERVIALEQGA